MELPSIPYLLMLIPHMLYRLARSLWGTLWVCGMSLFLVVVTLANPLFSMCHKSQAVKGAIWKRVLDYAFCRVLFIRPKEWKALERFIRDNEMTMKTGLEKFNEADHWITHHLYIGGQSWRRRIIQSAVLSIKIDHLISDLAYIKKNRRNPRV